MQCHMISNIFLRTWATNNNNLGNNDKIVNCCNYVSICNIHIDVFLIEIPLYISENGDIYVLETEFVFY